MVSTPLSIAATGASDSDAARAVELHVAPDPAPADQAARPSGDVLVTVQTLDGAHYSFQMRPTEQAGALKPLIAAEIGIPAQDQLLLSEAAGEDGEDVSDTRIGALSGADDNAQPAPLTLVLLPPLEPPYLTLKEPAAFTKHISELPTEAERTEAHPERAPINSASGAYINTTDVAQDVYLVMGAPGQEPQDARRLAFALTIDNGGFEPRADFADQDGPGQPHIHYFTHALTNTMTLVFAGRKFALGARVRRAHDARENSAPVVITDLTDRNWPQFAPASAVYMARIELRPEGSSVRILSSAEAVLDVAAAREAGEHGE